MSNQAPRQANGPAIRAIRQAAGVSLRTLAQLAGHDRGHLSRVERGAVGSVKLAADVAAVLSCTVEAVTVERAA